MDKRSVILLLAGLLMGGTAVYFVTAPSHSEPAKQVTLSTAAEPAVQTSGELPAASAPSTPVVESKVESAWKPAPAKFNSSASKSKSTSTAAAASTSKPAVQPKANPQAAVVHQDPKPEPKVEQARNESASEAKEEPKQPYNPIQSMKVPPPPPPQPKSVTLAAGTLLSVRVSETLSSEKSLSGDTFTGVLDAPLIVDGFVIAERGARVEGKVVEAWPAGRVKGRSRLAIELTKVKLADGQTINIKTASFAKDGESSTKGDLAKVGIGSAIGAAIGAMAGGGKGAAIGAGAGAAAGTGAVLVTKGKETTIPVETRLSFRIDQPVTITEKLRG
jgi:hypothetical protein